MLSSIKKITSIPVSVVLCAYAMWYHIFCGVVFLCVEFGTMFVSTTGEGPLKLKNEGKYRRGEHGEEY